MYRIVKDRILGAATYSPITFTKARLRRASVELVVEDLLLRAEIQTRKGPVLNGTKLRRVLEDLPLLLNLPLLAALLRGKFRFKCRRRSEIPNGLFCPKYSLTSCHSGQSSTLHHFPNRQDGIVRRVGADMYNIGLTLLVTPGQWFPIRFARRTVNRAGCPVGRTHWPLGG